MSDVTLILQRIQDGQAQASDELFPAVYEELRRLAAQRMNAERKDHTLSATALVHEAYIRLVDTDTVRQWDCRGHFFTAAAEAMRRILVEHARAKLRTKRGGDLQRAAELPEVAAMSTAPHVVLDFNEALERLAEEDAESAELVKLVFFAGLPVSDAGKVLGMSRNVAYRHWDFVRRWFAVLA